MAVALNSTASAVLAQQSIVDNAPDYADPAGFVDVVSAVEIQNGTAVTATTTSSSMLIRWNS